MNLNNFQELSARTINREPIQLTPEQAQKLNYALGMAGETGEVLDLLKKDIFHHKDVPREQYVKELGDAYHYLVGFATLMGIDMAEVAQVNLDKLAARYPEGFSPEAANARADERTDSDYRKYDGDF